MQHILLFDLVSQMLKIVPLEITVYATNKVLREANSLRWPDFTIWN